MKNQIIIMFSMSKITVWSGGQTGVDRGALDAALDLKIPHGGHCPMNRLAEDGRVPDKYELVEKGYGYIERTTANVARSDATLIISSIPLRRGTALTHRLTQDYNKPCMIIQVPINTDRSVKDFLFWIKRQGSVGILNVAGPRESTIPGIQEETRKFIKLLLLNWVQ